MLSMLKGWNGKVEINGEEYETITSAIIKNKALNGRVHIKLYAPNVAGEVSGNSKAQVQECNSGEVRITVKPYMTKPATPEFDFMAKWNNNEPMPLRTMQGIKVKETPGMVYMELHGQGQETITCLRCGKTLTNPISRHYGIGPECMNKLGIMCNIEDVDTIKEKLVDKKWCGWVIKSSILEEENI